MSWVRRRGEERRSERTGWVEDNVFAVLGLERMTERKRDPDSTALRSVDGKLVFQPLQRSLGSTYESNLRPYRVSRPKRSDSDIAAGLEKEPLLTVEPLQVVPCLGGATVVIHTFRPQRPRAYTSVGVRSGIAECEVVLPNGFFDALKQDKKDARKRKAAGSI
eukprot:762433-Hanusia_phi.AAC.2